METKIISAVYILLLGVCSVTKAQFMTDINGRPAREIKYTDVEGSPYLRDEWSVGFVKAKKSDKIIEFKRARYDVYMDELEFDKAGQLYRLSSEIQEFSIGDGTFRNGFPNADSFTEQSFYQIIYDGNTKLLKHYTVHIHTDKAYGSATETKRFMKDDVSYILKKNVMYKLKKDKKFLLELLADKQVTLEPFVKEQKLKMSKDEDIVKLLEKYDGL